MKDKLEKPSDIIEDFSLDSFFAEDLDEISINNFNSFKHNKLLFEKLAKENESDQRKDIIEQIVKNNQNLVIKSASKYVSISKSLTKEDLINEGNIGLLKAIERYTLSKGYEFSTYASYWIKQAITRAIADKSNIIRIPVHAFEAINKIRKIEKKLEFEKPNYTIEDILNAYGELTLEKYLNLKEIEFKFIHEVSLNNSLGNESDEEFIDFTSSSNNNDSYIFSLRGYTDFDVEEVIFQKSLKEELIKELVHLKQREQDIIKYRFGFIDGEAWTLEEIGKLYGVTRERIRQIESKALKKLKSRSINKKYDEFL